jgi:predicted MFS family arabinose efflux permease
LAVSLHIPGPVALARKNYPWFVTGVLFFCAALNYADRTAVSSVFPLLRHDFGMSDVALAAIGSFFLWSYASASPIAGLLADRFSRSRLVVCSLLLWSLATAITACAPNAAFLLSARVLLGLSECLYLPAAIALIADYHPASTRATAMAVHLAGLNAGMIVGGSLGGYLGQHYGWRTMFLALGGAGVLFAVFCGLVLRDTPKVKALDGAPMAGPAGILESLRAILTVPTYLVVILQAMLVAIGTWVFINWLPLYFAESFHMSLAAAGFSGTFTIQAAGVLGTIFGGYASDRAARGDASRRMLVQCLCLFASAPFLLSFIWSKNFFWISLSVFLYQLFAAMAAANEHPIICDVLDQRLRSTAIGCMNTVNSLAGGAGILLAGFFKHNLGLGAIFACASGFLLLAAFLVLAGYFWFLGRDLGRRSASSGAPVVIPLTL